MLNEVFENFKLNNYEARLEDDKIFIKLNILGEHIIVMVKIPKDYPYTFLEVLLCDIDQISFSIPHLLVGNQLCLYDLGNDRHNYKDYLKESLETLERATELLESAKIGELDFEYQHEFFDLWTVKEVLPMYSLLSNYETFSRLRLDSFIKSEDKKELVIIVKDKMVSFDSSYNLMKNLNLLPLKFFDSGLFIPIENSILKKPVSSVREFLNIIDNEPSRDKILDIIQKERIEYIFMGFKSGNLETPTLVGLKLPKLARPKGRLTKKKSIRNIFKFNGSREIIRFGLTDLSQERIITRAGEGLKQNKIKPYIIGCGSLGSYLSKLLCDTGKVESLFLQDNQILKSENIGRHLCGIEFVDHLKSMAVAETINSNYPSLKIQSSSSSYYQNLLKDYDEFSNEHYDIMICSTGDENIEEEIINNYEQGKISVPTIIIWVEAFLTIGHVLVLNAPMNDKSLKYIFDKNRNIKIEVIENSSKYSKSEAGCQSRFMPYSSYEMQKFCQVVIDKIINEELFKKEGIFHLIWFGKMKEARNNNITIKQQWRYRNDREILISRIDE